MKLFHSRGGFGWMALGMALLVMGGVARGAEGLAPLPTVERRPVLPRPLVFPRTQAQYSLYFNYIHWYTPEWYWVDRPLFFDASLTPPEGVNPKVYCPSFDRIVQTALPYEVDGFSSLITLAAQKRYLEGLACLDAHPVKDFSMVLGVAPVGKTSAQAAAAEIGKLLEKALAASVSKKIGQKVLIVSYNLDADPPEKWAEIQAILRKKYGDKFILVAALVYDWWEPYMRGDEKGALKAEDLEKLKGKLRSWLDVCDGIMYSAAGHATDPTDDDRLDQRFYTYITRICASVLSEPKYQKKYFGLQGALGYFNPITDGTSNDSGTKYLRDTLRIALAARPDFLILPEWDEVNENTCIEPTVYNSFSIQRIIRHTMRRLKNEPPAPMNGDDTRVPNLVLSYRAFLRVGRPLEVEVLNVPDGTGQGEYTLQLSLKDIDHKVVKTLPAATLRATELMDRTFRIPTEELAGHPVLMPSLTVTSPDGTKRTYEQGLMCIRLSATANWNKKWVRMPLRDLLHPTTARFERTDDRGPTLGPINVRGSVATEEKIASVEVVADGRELYAVDPKHTYELKPDEALILMVESAPERINGYDGKYYVTGGQVRQVVRQFGGWLARKPGQVAPTCTWSPLGEIFVVTHKDQAVLHVENSLYKTAIPVSEILEKGFYSEVHGKGATLRIQPYHAVPEMPLPLGTREASFETTVDPVRAETAIQMRIITESGKIYRSWPILVAPKAEGDVSLPVWSYTRDAPVTVKVDRSRIVRIDTRPSDAFGATVHDSADPSYYGLVGGLPSQSYVVRKAGSYPADAKQTAPKRVTEEGIDCWSFDGKGNFLYFPPESLPRGAFTLRFRFKPTSEARQTLLASYNNNLGTFELTMEKGRLSALYTDQLRREPPYYRRIPLEPDLAVPIGQWSTVEIVYDLKQIVFKVNGKAGKPIPLSTTGRIYTPLIFGGYGNGKGSHYFQGYLQELSLVHNAGE